MNRFRGVVFAPGEHAKVVRGEKNKYKYRWPTLLHYGSSEAIKAGHQS